MNKLFTIIVIAFTAIVTFTSCNKDALDACTYKDRCFIPASVEARVSGTDDYINKLNSSLELIYFKWIVGATNRDSINARFIDPDGTEYLLELDFNRVEIYKYHDVCGYLYFKSFLCPPMQCVYTFKGEMQYTDDCLIVSGSISQFDPQDIATRSSSTDVSFIFK